MGGSSTPELFPQGFMAAPPRLGFIGAGRMATALARGFVAQGLASAEQMIASDPLPAAAQEFARETGAKTTADNAQVAAAVGRLFLAVKPQQMAAGAGRSCAASSPAKQLVVSIAAGIRLAALAEWLGAGPAAGPRDAQHALPGRPRGLRLLPGRAAPRRTTANWSAGCCRRVGVGLARWTRNCWTP